MYIPHVDVWDNTDLGLGADPNTMEHQMVNMIVVVGNFGASAILTCVNWGDSSVFEV